MSEKLYGDANILLAAWKMGMIQPEQITAWADAVLLTDTPDIPDWLLELCSVGPIEYMKTSDVESPTGQRLSHQVLFQLQIEATDMANEDSINHFQNWLIGTAMEREMSEVGVKEAYQIDHLINDCGLDNEARALTMTLLRKHKPSCSLVNDRLNPQ